MAVTIRNLSGSTTESSYQTVYTCPNGKYAKIILNKMDGNASTAWTINLRIAGVVYQCNSQQVEMYRGKAISDGNGGLAVDSDVISGGTSGTPMSAIHYLASGETLQISCGTSTNSVSIWFTVIEEDIS